MNLFSHPSHAQMPSHWAERYLGEPWVADRHDCWQFVRRVWRERFGWEVAALEVDVFDRLASLRAFADHQEYRHWSRVDPAKASVQEGDACLMGRSARPSHVGIVVEIGTAAQAMSGASDKITTNQSSHAAGILHCLQGAGVVFTTYASLPSLGLRVLGHYRRKHESGSVPCR